MLLHRAVSHAMPATTLHRLALCTNARTHAHTHACCCMHHVVVVACIPERMYMLLHTQSARSQRCTSAIIQYAKIQTQMHTCQVYWNGDRIISEADPETWWLTRMSLTSNGGYQLPPKIQQSTLDGMNSPGATCWMPKGTSLERKALTRLRLSSNASLAQLPEPQLMCLSTESRMGFHSVKTVRCVWGEVGLEATSGRHRRQRIFG